MSDVPTGCLLIVAGLLLVCALIASIWIEVDEARRQRREWRKGRPWWVRILK
jgi:hypothetical protein